VGKPSVVVSVTASVVDWTVPVDVWEVAGAESVATVVVEVTASVVTWLVGTAVEVEVATSVEDSLAVVLDV